jgi:hypothetical protein
MSSENDADSVVNLEQKEVADVQAREVPRGAEAQVRRAAEQEPTSGTVTSPGGSDTPGGGIGNRTEYAWKVHSYINDYIRFADTKAAVIILFSSGLVAGLFRAGVHRKFVGCPATGLCGLGGVACAAFFLLTLAVILSAWAIRPRLRTTQKTGFIFWDSIRNHGPVGTFIQEFDSKTDGQLRDHILHHVRDLSNVCHSKYFWVARSLWVAVIGALLAGFVMLRQPVPGKATACPCQAAIKAGVGVTDVGTNDLAVLSTAAAVEPLTLTSTGAVGTIATTTKEPDATNLPAEE